MQEISQFKHSWSKLAAQEKLLLYALRVEDQVFDHHLSEALEIGQVNLFEHLDSLSSPSHSPTPTAESLESAIDNVLIATKKLQEADKEANTPEGSESPSPSSPSQCTSPHQPLKRNTSKTKVTGPVPKTSHLWTGNTLTAKTRFYSHMLPEPQHSATPRPRSAPVVRKKRKNKNLAASFSSGTTTTFGFPTSPTASNRAASVSGTLMGPACHTITVPSTSRFMSRTLSSAGSATSSPTTPSHVSAAKASSHAYEHKRCFPRKSGRTSPIVGDSPAVLTVPSTKTLSGNTTPSPTPCAGLRGIQIIASKAK
eukprot:TRINITY_DN66893_c6_g11_i1.p1 TRINITY_DN66893_c6_g11~~TRINITY_DN66893_c6_g11_i1.p1  ORF type:complete len:311 (-),score=2.26 TRINITY_DN66893_c6_g11_i1:139-1071(-)